MRKLKTHNEIKQFVIQTIKTGNKEKIQRVLKRYQEWLKEQEDKEEDIVEVAKKLFEVDRGG